MRHSLETAFPRRLAELYIWLFTIPLMVVAVIYGRVGFTAFGASGAAHLIITAVALGVLGRAVGAPIGPARLAGALLVLGSAIFWLGAITWPGSGLSSIATEPASHTSTAVLFLVGSLVTLAGFIGLRTILRAAGDEWLSQLGLVSFLFGTVMWAIHLVFRVTVVRPLAEQAASAPPTWFEPLHMWSEGLYAIYMVLAYLAIAAYGGALLKTQWVGKGWGRAFVVFGLVAAVGFLSPARLAFEAPLTVQFAPYAMGVLLLRKIIGDARQQLVVP